PPLEVRDGGIRPLPVALPSPHGAGGVEDVDHVVRPSRIGAEEGLRERQRDEENDQQLEEEKEIGRRPAQRAAREGWLLEESPDADAGHLDPPAPARVEGEDEACECSEKQPAGRREHHPPSCVSARKYWR